MKFEVGKIPVSISGKNPIVDALLEELSLFPKTEKSPYLEFLFFEDIHGMHKKHENNYFHIEQENYDLQIIGKFNGSNKTVVNILLHYREPNFWLSKLRWNITYRFNHWNYVTPVQSYAYNILGNIYQPIMHLQLLCFNRAFIHASSIVKNGKVILFPAKPGVGKTNTVIRMVNYGGWQFLADDFTIIREDSTAYLNPKYLPVYPYNLDLDIELCNQFLKTQSILDAIQWRHRNRKYGSRGVRRRISPVKLFGRDSIGHDGKIDSVFFLKKISDRYCTLQKINSDEIAQWSADITMGELWPSLKSLENVSFNRNQIMKKTVEIYSNAFSNKKCFCLGIPDSVNFEKVYEFLMKEISV